jgi:soluble lytic murein transglycosylase-like protein
VLPKPRPVKKEVPAPQSDNGRRYSVEEVQKLIVSYSQQYGILQDVPLCIAKHESGYNHLSKNKSSSASGVFQYLASTWRGTDEGKAGISVFDADANVRAAIKYMASRKSTKPWTVASKCPSL